MQDRRAAFDIVYETGEREIKNTDGTGSPIDLSSRRLILQGRTALGDAFQLIGRGIPGTGRLNFEGSGFNPTMWGFGAGLQFAPPEAIADIVHLGAVAYWDWSFGATDRPGPLTGSDKVNWAEGTVAAGASVRVVEIVDVYAGATLIKPDIHLDVSGTETNWEEDSTFGGLMGFSVQADEVWKAGLELHFNNEQTIGFMLSYAF
jgi:hypothetical protein